MKLTAVILFASVFSFGQNVVSNPTATQPVNQPAGTYLEVTRIAADNTVVIPGGSSPPSSAPCRNYSLYLQQLPGGLAPSTLWRCIRRRWMAELAPHVQRIEGEAGQTAVTITQPTYIPASLQVFRNGVLQDPTAAIGDYAVKSGIVTFASPLKADDKIALAYLALN